MKRFLKVLFCLNLLLLTGCREQRTGIAYTIYPTGFILERLAPDYNFQSIQDETIIQRATMNDNYKNILSNSLVLFYVGKLEPYFNVYANEINELCPNQIDLSAMNAVYDFKRFTPIYTGDDITYVESSYYNSPVMDSIDIDAKDLYIWTDPISMLSMAKDIRDWLVSTYPDDRATFESNFEKLETDLINLDAQYQSFATNNIIEKREVKFVSMTASFGNWQKTYGFQVYPVILSKYGVLPNEEQLEVIENRIRDDNVRYIVYEPNMTSDMTELFNRIEDDLNLTRVELSNLSSISDSEEASGKDYISIMYENLSVLETISQPRVTEQSTQTEETVEEGEEAVQEDNQEENGENTEEEVEDEETTTN